MYRTYLLYLFLFSSLSLFSQKEDNYLDVLYLKNKEVYRGLIVKNEMGIVSIQIEENGEKKTKQFQYFEIDRIQKEKTTDVEGGVSTALPTMGKAENIAKAEEALINHSLINTERQIVDNATIQPFPSSPIALKKGKTKNEMIEDPFTPIPYIPRRVRVWTRQIRGFRGFTDVAFNLGVGNYANNNLQVSQSIGFQFNPIAYLGVGAAYRYSFNRESSMPVFINPRLNLTDRNDWNPFWDIKAGLSPIGGKGVFASTAFGMGFVMGKRRQYSFNIGLSYSFQKAKFQKRDDETSKYKRTKEDYHEIGIVTSFEF